MRFVPCPPTGHDAKDHLRHQFDPVRKGHLPGGVQQCMIGQHPRSLLGSNDTGEDPTDQDADRASFKKFLKALSENHGAHSCGLPLRWPLLCHSLSQQSL